MDGAFRSWYEKPALQRSYAYNPSLFEVPVYPVDPTRQARHSVYADRQQPVEKKSSRRVVQIPVQFFGSDSDRRSESARRIQMVFRGFFVRKSVRKIKDIRSQIDEIEARLLRDEVVEMIRGNERERLRMSESLMNLLLKLDGIRGIDSGIRVCRKGLTRKAIALQEKIDAICTPDCKVESGSKEIQDGVPAAAYLEGSGFEENSENSNDFEEESMGLNSEKMQVERDAVLTEDLDVVVASEVKPSEETPLEPETGILKNIDFDEDNVDSVKEMLDQYTEKDMINGQGKEDDDAIGNCEFRSNSELGEMLGDAREEVEHEDGEDVEVKEILEVGMNGTPETCPGQGTVKNLDSDGDAETVKVMLALSDDHGETLGELSEELKGGDSLEIEDKTMEIDTEHLDAESIEASPVTQGAEETPQNLDFGVETTETMEEMPAARCGEEKAVVENEDLNKRKCELLEQMMEENKKMMLTMSQLYERNEMQLQMLDALANRVELLEKAYLSDKLRNRRKKMKKNKCAVTD